MLKAGRAPTDPDAAENEFNRQPGVAEWRDRAKLPKLSNDLLDEASGITIPSSNFVLRVILAYLIAVIPLNWLICRFVLNRREWTWVVVPLVALAFAIGVERVAARDIGYDTAADEIDLLEIHGDYARGHLTPHGVVVLDRAIALHASRIPTTRRRLPCRSTTAGRSAAKRSRPRPWQSYPGPSLIDFTVQPRSLSMFRAEQMLSLSGPIRLEEEGGKRRVVNGGELELRDAILIDQAGPAERRRALAGYDRRGRRRRDRRTRTARNRPSASQRARAPTRTRFWRNCARTGNPREENQGELRLVAWVAGTDRRASDRAGRRSAPGFHRGRGPSAERQPAQPRRPAVQPARRRRAGPGRLAISSKMQAAQAAIGAARPPARTMPSSPSPPRPAQDQVKPMINREPTANRRSTTIHDRGDQLHQAVRRLRRRRQPELRHRQG